MQLITKIVGFMTLAAFAMQVRAELAVWHDTADIQRAAEHHVAADSVPHSTARADVVDRRLRLKQCDVPLSTRYLGNPEGARLTVQVSCTGTVTWRVYVPVRVTRFADVVVTTRFLARGEQVQATDIDMARRDLNTSSQAYLTDLQAAIGREVRRSVPAGVALSATALTAPALVARGATVTLIAGSSPIAIRMTGIAEHDAALGERIAVRNLSSNRIVEGRVVDRDTVEVGLSRH